MFFGGIAIFNTSTITSIPVFFLTLERCLALKLSGSNYTNLRSRLIILSIVVVIGSYLWSSLIFLLELPLSVEKGLFNFTLL